LIEPLIKHTKCLMVVLTLLVPALSVKAVDEISKEKLESEGKQRSYYIFVPSSVKPDSPVPLLIVLHGSGRNGLSLVEKWKDLATEKGFIVAGPDASDRSGWRIPEDGPEFIYDLTELLIKKYPIAKDRLYLFGHSAGAVFALNLAMFESEYFAAVAFHAGSWRSERELKLPDLAIRKTPIKIIVGDRDAFFPLDSVKQTEAVLKASGFNVAVTIIKNHNHWYYDKAPDINRDVWDFLQQNLLTSERRHVRRVFNSSAKNVTDRTKQINALRIRADQFLERFYALEDELRGKDFVKDKTSVSETVQRQVQTLTEAAKALRDSAAEAEQASQMKTSDNYKEYFSLLAQSAVMRAESAELLRTRSELLLSNEDANSITVKRGEAVKKAHSLNQAAEEMEKRANRLVQ
jgi:predicted esterase